MLLDVSEIQEANMIRESFQHRKFETCFVRGCKDHNLALCSFEGKLGFACRTHAFLLGCMERADLDKDIK